MSQNLSIAARLVEKYQNLSILGDGKRFVPIFTQNTPGPQRVKDFCDFNYFDRFSVFLGHFRVGSTPKMGFWGALGDSDPKLGPYDTQKYKKNGKNGKNRPFWHFWQNSPFWRIFKKKSKKTQNFDILNPPRPQSQF